MAVTIDSLELKITHDSADAVKGINSLVRALRRLKEVAGMGADLLEVARAIRVIKQATAKNNIASGTVSAMKQIKQATNDATQACDAHVRAWEHYRDIQDRISDMTIFDGNVPSGENHYVQREVQLQGNTPTDDAYWSGWEDHMDSFRTAAQLAKEAKEATKQQNAAQKAITDELTRQKKIEDDVVKAYEKQQIAAEKAAEKEKTNRYKEAVRQFKEAEKEKTRIAKENARARLKEELMASRLIKDSTKGITRTLSMIGRTILRRLILGAIRAITSGVKEGMENLYRYSDIMNSMDSASAKNSLDQVATSLLYMRNAVAAAVAPLIQSLVPVLQTVVNWAVSAANAINMFISSLQGKSTFTKAKESVTKFFDDVKSGASGAGKAAKEARATLLAFDEINRLDADNSGSGGGGGGSSNTNPDWANMFEEADIDMTVLDKIKDTFKDILWYAGMIGAAIAGWKLGQIMSDFMGLNLGKSLALSAGLAITLAGLVLEVKGITDIITNGINIENFGETLLGGLAVTGGGAIIGAVFGEAVVGAAVGAIVAGAGMLFVSIYDAFSEGMSWMTAGLFEVGMIALFAGIGGLVGGPLGLALGAVSGAIYGAIGALELWLVTTITSNWSEICDFIETTASDTWKWLKSNIFSPVETAWNTLTQWIGEKFSGVKNLIVTAWTYVKTKTTEIWNAIKQYFDPLISFFTTAFTDVKNGIVKVWNDIKSAASKTWDWIKTTVTTVWTDIKTAATNTFNTIKQGLQPLITWFTNTFNSIKKTVKEVWKNIKVIINGDIAIIKAAVKAVWDWAKKNVITPMSTAVVAAWTVIKTAFSTAATWIQEKVIKPLASKLTNVWSGFKTAASNAWEGIKKVFGGVATWFGNTFSAAWEKVKKVFSVGGQVFTSIASGISATFKSIVNSLITGINRVVKVPFSAINTMLTKIRDAKIFGIQPFSALKTITIPSIPYMAQGGFVDSPGQLFVANEQGAELVGSINGRTAVASNQEITGIADAVYGTGAQEAALLRQQNDLLRQLLQKDMTAVVSTDSIVSGLARKNRRDGVSTVPVSV